MKIYQAFLFLASITALCAAANSANLRLVNSPLSDTMNHPTISKIHRDSHGILWIASQNGLYRFDGSSLTSFNSHGSGNNWIPASNITDVAENSHGTLYILAHTGGLFELDRSNSRFEPRPHATSEQDSIYFGLHISKNDMVWMGTSEGIFLYDPDLDVYSGPIFDPAYEDNVTGNLVFLEEEKGSMLVGSKLGLARIDTTDITMKILPLDTLDLPKNFGVSALAFDAYGDILLATKNGHLAKLAPDFSRVLATNPSTPSTFGSVTDIESVGEYVFWATDSGLYISSSSLSGIENISDVGDGLSSNIVSAIFLDNDQIWIGTWAGLYILSFPTFETRRDFDSETSNDVTAFAEDSKGTLWIGTHDGLYHLDRKTNTHIRFSRPQNEPGLVDQKISALAILKNELWIGLFKNGVQIMDLDTNKVRVMEDLQANNIAVINILADPDGDHVWIATESHGLFRVSDGNIFNYADEGVLPAKTVTQTYRTKKGVVFVVTVNQVYIYDVSRDSFTILNFDFGFSERSPTIHNIQENARGDLWIATSDRGLFRWSYENQSAGNLELDQTSYSNSMHSFPEFYDVQLDSQDNLWCSTRDGIIVLDETGSLVRRFSAGDGLQDDDFNLGAAYTSQNRYVYFGGLRGYNKFDFSEDIAAGALAIVKLDSIGYPASGSQKFLDGGDFSKLEVSRHDFPLTLNFSTLDFIDPTKNQYRYKLENFDADWIESGSINSATYTNLPPGNYIFKVQGANSSGIWNREGASIAIHVLPPPWLSWWAYCLYCLTLAAVLWGFHRIYRSFAIERRATELALEMHLAEERADDDMQEQVELQEDLVKSAYKHNVATLSLVSEFISKEGTSEKLPGPVTDASANKLRLEALSYLEDCLYFQAGGPVADLHKYSDMVIARLLLTAPVDQETIVTVNEVPEQLIQTSIASPLSAIIYELLSNSINHAFEPGSSANYLQITLTRTAGIDGNQPGSTFELSVSDSGTGMPDNVADLSSGQSGLKLVESLAGQLGGVVHYKTESGTTVSVRIPCPPEH